jgi:hypothetical protein
MVRQQCSILSAGQLQWACRIRFACPFCWFIRQCNTYELSCNPSTGMELSTCFSKLGFLQWWKLCNSSDFRTATVRIQHADWFLRYNFFCGLVIIAAFMSLILWCLLGVFFHRWLQINEYQRDKTPLVIFICLCRYQEEVLYNCLSECKWVLLSAKLGKKAGIS